MAGGLDGGAQSLLPRPRPTMTMFDDAVPCSRREGRRRKKDADTTNRIVVPGLVPGIHVLGLEQSARMLGRGRDKARA